MATTLVLLAAGLAATHPSSGAEPRTSSALPSACAPPALGFGAGEGRNDAAMPPTVGDLRIAMLFVDFSDSPAATAPQTIFDSSVPRLVHWYRTVSYDRLRVTVVPYLRWLRLPLTLTEYDRRRFEGAVQAAVAAADPEFDFSSIDALYVVPAMPSLASTIVDHVPLRADGAEVNSWAWLATGSLERLPFVAIHETGHILGLPDLYQIRAPSSQHRWDVMTAAAIGGGMFAWHRWKLGWLDPAQITCLARPGSVKATLAPVERVGGKKALISRVGKAAVVVEVRGRVAEDASLCRSGVLLYRVDFTAGSPRNAGLRRMPIRLEPAHTEDSRQWERCGRGWRAPFGVGRGEVSETTAWGHRIRVLRVLADGSYSVRMTRM